MFKTAHAKRFAIATASLALCATIGVGAAIADSTPSEPQGSGPNGEMLMEDWGALYPLEYSSYQEETVKDGRIEGHYTLKAKLLAPGERVLRPDGQYDTKMIDTEGDYNTGDFIVHALEWDPVEQRWYVPGTDLDDLSVTRERMGCYSCKSKNFDFWLEEYGASTFTDKMTPEFVEYMNGQVWSCNTCHAGDPATTAPDTDSTYWLTLAKDNADLIDAGDRVCGQCHNSYDHRSRITSQEVMDAFDPYKYGFDAESVYKAAMEDGIYTTDDLGIDISCLDHPDVEFLQNSAHDMAGLTCVSCHMPKTVDEESGETFTYHNASASPSDNPVAMETCLSCHSSDSIQTADDMLAMVRGVQGEAEARIAECDKKFTAAHEAIAAAMEAGVDEATVQQAKDDYSLAEALYHYTKGGKADGSKIVHNAKAGFENYDHAIELLDGIVENLSA